MADESHLPSAGSRIRRVINADQIAIGAHTGAFAGPAIVELIGFAGFDAAFIDLEHAPLDLHDLQLLMVAASAAGVSSVVRIPLSEQGLFLRVLDMGADAIYVPHVRNAREAKRAVEAVRYAPLGDRGMAVASRAAGYGSVQVEEHIRRANADVVLAVMIEDVEALDHVEEIAAVPGIDLVAIGPSDLSQSLGLPSDRNHPALVAAVEQVALAVAAVPRLRMAIPLEHRLLDLAPTRLHELGVRYGNLGSGPEARLLASLRGDVGSWRAREP